MPDACRCFLKLFLSLPHTRYSKHTHETTATPTHATLQDFHTVYVSNTKLLQLVFQLNLCMCMPEAVIDHHFWCCYSFSVAFVWFDCFSWQHVNYLKVSVVNIMPFLCSFTFVLLCSSRTNLMLFPTTQILRFVLKLKLVPSQTFGKFWLTFVTD